MIQGAIETSDCVDGNIETMGANVGSEVTFSVEPFKKYSKEALQNVRLRADAIAEVWRSLETHLRPFQIELQFVTAKSVQEDRRIECRAGFEGREKKISASDDRVVWIGASANMEWDDISERVSVDGSRPSRTVEFSNDGWGGDSEDDEETFQHAVLQVQGEPDFESGPPEDGWEYLRRVRYLLTHPSKMNKSQPSRFKSIRADHFQDNATTFSIAGQKKLLVGKSTAVGDMG